MKITVVIVNDELALNSNNGIHKVLILSKRLSTNKPWEMKNSSCVSMTEVRSWWSSKQWKHKQYCIFPGHSSTLWSLNDSDMWISLRFIFMISCFFKKCSGATDRIGNQPASSPSDTVYQYEKICFIFIQFQYTIWSNMAHNAYQTHYKLYFHHSNLYLVDKLKALLVIIFHTSFHHCKHRKYWWTILFYLFNRQKTQDV